MQIFDCAQGSPEWFQCRMGIPTASEFATCMASGRGGGDSKTCRTYMLKLAGEILTGRPTENYSNGFMERGHEQEPDARSKYAFLANVEPQIVGFIRRGDKGALEIKSKAAHLQIDLLDRDEFPPEHRAQCQGVLWVAEREWIDLACYCPDLPLFVKREYRDDLYIRKMAESVRIFNEELAELVAKIRAMQEAA